jgi:hypothetical protein
MSSYGVDLVYSAKRKYTMHMYVCIIKHSSIMNMHESNDCKLILLLILSDLPWIYFLEFDIYIKYQPFYVEFKFDIYAEFALLSC